jgi:hypothetical protein
MRAVQVPHKDNTSLNKIEGVCRSLRCYELEGKMYLSICLEDDSYLRIEVKPNQAASLNEGAARFVGSVVRKVR